jgi:hypothetical protein
MMKLIAYKTLNAQALAGGFYQLMKNKNGLDHLRSNPLLILVRPERFERPTPWFVGLKANEHIFIYQYLTSVRHT